MRVGLGAFVYAVPTAYEESSSTTPQETPNLELKAQELSVQGWSGPVLSGLVLRIQSYLNDPYCENFPPNAIHIYPCFPKIINSSDNYDLCDFKEDCEREDIPLSFRAGLLYFGLGLELSKTTPVKLVPRSAFRFNCLTSIKCPGAGCCPAGSWCTVTEGQRCCGLPSEKECLAFPNYQCAIPCGDTCCNTWDGLDPMGS